MPERQPQRLDGWKAIADHLGRDARTAQRWHRERGMPVHHVPGNRGGTVFAFRSELDEWLAKGVASPIPRATGSEAAPPSKEVAAADHGTAKRPRVFVATGIVAVAALAAVGVFGLRTSGVGVIPAQLELNGRTVSALDANRQTLWSFHLPEGRIGDYAGPTPRMAPSAPIVLRVNGWIELVALVPYADLPGTHEYTEVYSWSTGGDLLWRHRVTRSLSFGGQEFTGPWRQYGNVVATPNDGRLWLSFIHHTWWPSFVISLGPMGSERLAFVNAGHIQVLQRIETSSGVHIVAGGFNNESMLPALAAFTEEGPAVVSPQTSGTPYFCNNCPAGHPLKYVLFPRSELNLAVGAPFVSVTEILKPDATGVLEVSVSDSVRSSRAVYRLTTDLTPRSVAFSDSYWKIHQELSDAGKIQHQPEDCPERRAGSVARVWQATTGWKDVRVGPTFSPKID